MPADVTGLGDLYDAIVAAIAADLGTFDLSATGRVQRGTFEAPPASLPFVSVEPPQVSGGGQARETLRTRTASWTIRGWAAYTSEDGNDRTARAVLLLDEILAALESARASAVALRACLTFGLQGAVLEPVLAQGVPVAASVRITVTTTYRRHTGNGG